MKSKKGFTFVELIVALLICSLILIFLIPNLVKQSEILTTMERELEMKEILYEEMSNSDEESFSVNRDSYEITVTKNSATIENKVTGKRLVYEK